MVIMDVTLPELNGLAATPEIKTAIPSAEILIFTQHESSQIIREARNAGASGYLLKSQANWLVTALWRLGNTSRSSAARTYRKLARDYCPAS